MEEEIVILISNVFLPQKNNPVIQKERIKTRKTAHDFFFGKQVLREGHSLVDLAEKHVYSTRVHFCLPAVRPPTFCLFWSKQNCINNMK